MIRSLYLQILYWWNYRPLIPIMIVGVVLRILAAIFSKGYGMHDDHFLVIEVAQKWLEGIPQWFNLGKPSLHSLIYPGFHYVLFAFLEKISITDPQAKMYVVRFIHAAYSMIIVYYGYKITLRISDKKTARQVGMILAALWCLPFLSVRNLREITCIPPLMIGFDFLLSYKRRPRISKIIWSALFFVIAFTFRYQTLFFPLGIGMVLIYKKEIKELLYFSFFFLVLVFLIQGLLDWYAWGYPFASLHAYYLYNKEHANHFITAAWYQHLLTILGFLGPPVSLIFIWGFLRTWNKVAEMFWPVFLFLVFHSIFPNKQERFIFPLIPFIIMLGIVGWEDYIKRASFWRLHFKLLRGLWVYFWIINCIVLTFYTLTYSKRSRVETMYYLGKKADYQQALLETYRSKVPFPPLFYLDKWQPEPYELDGNTSLRRLKRNIKYKGGVQPNYIVFFGDKDLEKRVQRLRILYPILQPDKVIEGSLIDEILLKLNPKYQANEKAYIYKIGKSHS